MFIAVEEHIDSTCLSIEIGVYGFQVFMSKFILC